MGQVQSLAQRQFGLGLRQMRGRAIRQACALLSTFPTLRRGRTRNCSLAQRRLSGFPNRHFSSFCSNCIRRRSCALGCDTIESSRSGVALNAQLGVQSLPCRWRSGWGKEKGVARAAPKAAHLRAKAGLSNVHRSANRVCCARLTKSQSMLYMALYFCAGNQKN